MSADVAAGRPWSLNRSAAKAIALNALDVDGRHLRDREPDTLDALDCADARQLLDALGLIDGPLGREVVPDDRRSLNLELLRACPGEPTPDDAFSTDSTGESMSDLITVPRRRGGRPSIPIQHGTEHGYQQHKRKRQPIPHGDACGCQAAHDATLKRPPAPAPVSFGGGLVEEARASVSLDGETHVVGLPLEDQLLTDVAAIAPPTPATIPKRPAPALPPIEHGTVDGYHAHLDRGALPVCADCPKAIDELATGLQAPGDPPVELVERATSAASAPTLAPVDLDVWFTAAEQSTSTSVRRAARAASTALLQLCQAMDALSRAERAELAAAGEPRG